MSHGRKFVIPPFRPNVHMDSSNAERIWGALRAAIQEIYNKNASSLSYEELYRCVMKSWARPSGQRGASRRGNPAQECVQPRPA